MKLVSSLFSLTRRAALASGMLFAAAASAQGPAPRILAPIDSTSRIVLPHSRPPRARAEDDAGLLPQSTRIQGISINFSHSPAQQADLDALLAAQYDPTSPLFHRWLTPDQFSSRFGAAQTDLQAVQNWLTAQGFTIDGVSRGLNRITFTGTEAQIEAAFQTQLHSFTVDNERHFAPASDLTLPASLAGVIQSVGNLSDFQPHPHLQRSVSPAFTSGQTGSHFLTPKDVATIYDINRAYSAGYTGAGQSIAIVGQSAVILSDIANFKSAAGVTSPAPIPVLYPGSGASTLKTRDESESDLDLEYSGAIAPGATVYFVYTGASSNYGAFDALAYAIINDIAPVISSSYGQCEVNLGAANYAYFNQYLQQAAAQGQTVLAAAGDAGSTDCYGETGTPSATQIGLAVDFPGSSTWVTSMGGTEISAANAAATNSTYFSSNGTNDVLGSALSYIPEGVWNDDSTSQLSAGGGGVSIYTARPTWQAGVIGGVAIPSGSFRLVPDLSLMASPLNASYLYCSSDSQGVGVQGSCSNGFRDGNNAALTAAGGTSFASPIFAGMMAIINQATKSAGQGLINPILYTLAANSSTYASAFHDITSGTNACVVSPASLSCASSGLTSFTAAAGYDEATGLGSVDLYNLLTAWPIPSATTSALAGSILTASAATTTPRIAVADTLTFTVGRGVGSSPTAAPTGSVNLTITQTTSTTTSTTNAVYATSTTTATVPLNNGVATYSFVGNASGQFSVLAQYAGDAVYAPSRSTLLLQVGSSGSFSLSTANASVTSGTTLSEPVTVTPINGYAGTVAFSVTVSPVIANACYNLANLAVTGTSPANASLTIYTNQANCTGSASPLVQTGGLRRFVSSAGVARGSAPVYQPSNALPFALSFAGLLVLGVTGRRSRKISSLVAVLLFTTVVLVLSACSGASTPPPNTVTPTNNVATGPYTIVVQGTDTVTNTTTNFASFTLLVK